MLESEAGDPQELLQRLLSLLSHELRSPLNSLQSWSHVLENEVARSLTQESGRQVPCGPTPLAQSALAGIRNGVREQVRLIDQLLDASRAMSGSAEVECCPVIVLSAVEAALQEVQPAATAKGIRVDVEMTAADTQVEADPARLRQAVAQLLSNAIKFSPDDSQVSLTVARDAGSVLITVTDQGVGLSPEFMPRLFQWFQRADTGHAGLGLGLAQARYFCELQGGEIGATSCGPDCGSSFTLRFPEYVAPATRSTPLKTPVRRSH